MKSILSILIFTVFLSACASGEKVVKPRTHKIWPRGNKYVIDIPVGTRHIQLIKRKRTRVVRMK
jgi:hypothetical protein